MAIIRDAAGSVFNIPDDELKKYLVSAVGKTTGDKHPDKLCLEPRVDAEHGPRDGWEYSGSWAMPKRKSMAARKVQKKKKK
jgi:hypothetical protein